MPSLSESVAGIPIPPDELRAALQAAAIPGFTGTVQVEVCMDEEAAKHVTFAVLRRQSKRVEDEPARPERHVLPDPTRKKPVEKVLNDLRSKLRIRPVVPAYEFHFLDGVLQKVTISE